MIIVAYLSNLTLQVIALGSQTTLVHHGVSEPYAPAQYRFPTRMFPGQKKGQYEPVKVRPRQSTNGNSAGNGAAGDDTLWEEDPLSEEGAIYPIKCGRVCNWGCFKAFLEHIHTTLSPGLHTPILIVISPDWSPQDRETLTSFVFEKTQTPGLLLINSSYAVLSTHYNIPDALIVDVGYEKTDIISVVDWCADGLLVNKNCSGKKMTQNLYGMLHTKGFTWDMCEQLKKSSICEILLPNTPLPVDSPAVVATSGITNGSSAGQGGLAPVATTTGPGIGTEMGEEHENTKSALESDGVLDVASIVASGKTSEFLAKKEREKADKANAKKSAEAAAKNAKLANSQKASVMFQYTEGYENGAPVRKEIEVGNKRFRAMADNDLGMLAYLVNNVIGRVPDKTKHQALWDNIVVCGNGSKVRGFKEALLATLNMYYLISRSNSIFTSELPSTIVTPLATGANTPNPLPAVPTTAGLQHQASSSSAVNPLLLAATTAANPALAPPPNSQQQQHGANAYAADYRNQTPTNIRLAPFPDYFSMWKDCGYEEMAFLGASMTARLIFVVGASDLANTGYMSRAKYNDEGPKAIKKYGFMG